AKIGQRQDASTPASLHQWGHRARQADERVGAHVQRQAKPVARGFEKRLRELRLRRERGAVDEKIETAELAIERRPQRVDLIVGGDVARKDERTLELGGELPDILLQPLGRIRQREPRASRRSRLRNPPRNRALVGHTDNETEFARKIRQGFGGLAGTHLERLRPWP